MLLMQVMNSKFKHNSAGRAIQVFLSVLIIFCTLSESSYMQSVFAVHSIDNIEWIDLERHDEREKEEQEERSEILFYHDNSSISMEVDSDPIFIQARDEDVIAHFLKNPYPPPELS